MKTANRSNPGSGAHAPFQDHSFDIEYKIFVHKDDLDFAAAVIAGRLGE